MSLRRKGVAASAIIVGLAWWCACSPPGRDGESRPAIRDEGLAGSVDPPAVEGAFAPRWSLDRGAPLLSWLEPAGPAHRLRFARWSDGAWSEPVTVAEGEDFFANWADTPGVVATGTGELRAHWLQKTSDETYSYSIALAHSTDGGRNWAATGFLNEDETMTEHGFVSYALDAGGALTAVWLDGREMASGGAMTLRAGRVGEPSTVLDDRVCECCATDVARSADGFVVVYRDRSPDELRDISVVRSTGEAWSEPATIHDDGWRIEGCPVNGPAVAADGSTVAVAWFTASEETPRVAVALSEDGGASFSEPLPVDAAEPIGRVDVAWWGDSGALTWLGRDDDDAVVYLQGLSRDGTLGVRTEVARTEASRRSGVPVLAVGRDEVHVAWTEARPDTPLKLRVRAFPRAGLQQSY